MDTPKLIPLVIIIALLSGCASTPAAINTATPAPPTQRSPVKLPPTWTPTASVPPSETPDLPPTLTFTPFPSATPLPSTLTPSPTSDNPTPTATPTITPTIDMGCYVFALEAGVPIYEAPFTNPYLVLPTMSPTTTYQATSIYPPYYQLALDDEFLGWVDYRLLTLASQGAGCNQLPTDTRELSTFPGLCSFTADGDLETYSDRGLLSPYQTITSTASYALLLQYSDVYLASGGESGSSFFVDANQVRLSGDCERLPSTGVTTANGWLWSQPDVDNGEPIAALTPGYRVFIQESSVEGPGPPSLSEEGLWYFVLVSPPEAGLTGWVWSSLIFVD